MNSIFQNNIDAIRKKWPDLAGNLEQYNSNEKMSYEHIELEKTRNGMLNFRVSRNSRKVYLHSNYDPFKEADRWIKTLNVKVADTIIILGAGVGYHLDRIVKEYPHKNKIIIEPDPSIFLLLLRNRDIVNIIESQNILFVIGDEIENIVKLVMGLRSSGQVDCIEFAELVSYDSLYGDWWIEFKKQYIKYLKIFNINVNTLFVFKKEWYENFCENIREIPESVFYDKYKDNFKGIPAIIVSAGPSLKKNIELLKGVYDKALIISCGSAINILESRGIKPHIMAGVDPGEDQYKIFGSVKSKDIYFLYTVPMYYKAVKSYKGPKLYYRTASSTYVKWFEEKVGINSLGTCSGASVSNSALDIARIWGCSPIILIGQDLGFTGMEVYADGAVLKDKWDKTIRDRATNSKKSDNILMKDINGNDIYTDQPMLSIKIYFEDYLKTTENVEVINCTEGGIPIDGVPNMNLSDAIDKYCKNEYDIEGLLGGVYENEKGRALEFAPKVDSFMLKLSEEIKAMRKLGILRLKIMNEMVNKKMFDVKKWKKVESITKRLERYDCFINLLTPIARLFLISLKNANERLAEVEEDKEKKRWILMDGLQKQYGFILDNINYIYSILERQKAEDQVKVGNQNAQ